MSEYLSYEEKTAEVYKEIIKCLNYCIEEKEAMWKAADENTDMCEAIKGIFEDGKAEGIAEGRAEGIAEGEAKGRAEEKARSDAKFMKALENLIALGMDENEVKKALGLL